MNRPIFGNPISIFVALSILVVALMLAGCDVFSSAIDERAPRVEIIHPGGDTAVGGEHVLILIKAEALGEDNWISFVNVTVDSEKVGEAAPVGDLFQLRLNSDRFADGAYRVEAVAFDRFQARGTSAARLLTVQNQSLGIGPEFDIIAPEENEEVVGNVRIVARARPGQPLPSAVELIVDGVAVLSSSTATGDDTYVFEWDTSTLLSGEHIVQVKSFGDPGVFRYSEPVVVSVAPIEEENRNRHPGTIAWRTAGYSGDIRGSVAVGFNNDLYVGSGSDTLYAFSANGTLKWKFATRGPIRSAPLVGNNEDVFVTSEDGRLYGLDSDGHALWTAYNTGSNLRSSPTLGIEGALFFGDADGRVHGVSSFNGQPLSSAWPVSVSFEPIVAPPVIAKDRTLYIAAGDGYIYALSPGGSILWQSTEAIGSVSVGMALVEEPVELIFPENSPSSEMMHVLYAVSGDGYLYALSGHHGIVLWRELLDGPQRSAPVVGTDGTIYVGTSKGLVAFNNRIDAFTPRLRFIFPADDVGTPAIDSNEVVYFVSRKIVHAINPNNTPYWNFNAGAESDAPLTITRQGLLVVAGQNGVLTALETGSVGLALANWPMFQRNARHTGRLGIDAGD